MSTISPKRIVLAVVGVIALVFALFVWPTQYKYERVQQGRETFLVRIDRFTGQTEFLASDGWRREVIALY